MRPTREEIFAVRQAEHWRRIEAARPKSLASYLLSYNEGSLSDSGRRAFVVLLMEQIEGLCDQLGYSRRTLDARPSPDDLLLLLADLEEELARQKTAAALGYSSIGVA